MIGYGSKHVWVLKGVPSGLWVRVERFEPEPDPTHLSDVSADVSDPVTQRVHSVDSGQCVLTQSINTTALPKAVQSSFQVQIEPFFRQWIRDDPVSYTHLTLPTIYSV